MSENIIQLNEEVVKGEIRDLVRKSVEETLNEMLDASAGVLFVDRRFDVPYRSADCLEIPRVDHAGDVPGVENGVESGVDGDAVNVSSVVIVVS